jgi:hypothetical protein
MTSFNLLLNVNNVIQKNGFYNQLTYNFINGSFTVKEKQKLQLVSAQIPYSFFNISQSLNNNSFNILWPKGSGLTTYNVIIPDGFYSYIDLNNYIIYYCKLNGLYLIDTASNVQNYISISSNSTYYAVQLNLSVIPTSLPTGWTNPASLQFPTVAQTPRIQILNNKFSNYIGFSPATYPASQQITAYYNLSNITPQSSTTNSIVLRCNLISNNVSIPSDILDSFGIFNTLFGSNINYASSLNDKKTTIKPGTYNSMTIDLVNENNEPLQCRDPNMLINLLITSD